MYIYIHIYIYIYIYYKILNHPPQIIKQLATIISNRLWKNLTNEEIFNESIGEYDNALKQSGYNNINLKCHPPVTSITKEKCYRNIILYNRPGSRNVSTNIVKL